MCRVHFPDVFSPSANEKGQFVPRIINASSRVLFNMVISDAEGRVVCETYGHEEGWDGTFRGVPCPGGVYHYAATILETDKDPSQQFSATGSVKLMR